MKEMQIKFTQQEAEWREKNGSLQVQLDASKNRLQVNARLLFAASLDDWFLIATKPVTFWRHKRPNFSFIHFQASESAVGRLEKTKFELQAKNAALQEKIVGLQNDLVDVKEECRQKESDVDERER